MNRDPKRKVGLATIIRTRGPMTTDPTAKQHAFFSNFATRKEEAQLPPSQRSTVKQTSPPTVEHFLHLDPFVSSTGESSSSSSTKPIKIAMYDLDGTLIEPKNGKGFPKSATDWKWWDVRVKPKLAEAHAQG
jgi:hypothetical protein